MLTWAEHQDEYLDEMLRLEGRGYAAVYSKCAGCGGTDPTFRCERQLCHGPSMFCKPCIEWNGSFCERRALKDLGLVIQLGHPIGFGCPNPPEANKNFTVIDTTGVHNVAVNFCACDGRVERRQQLMRVCWWPATVRDPQTCATFAVVSAHDFLRSLELLTNNDELHPLPISSDNLYRMTLMMKRAGRGHDPSGVKGTAQGQLALQCRMCPQDGKNLPDGWDKIDWDKMPKDLRCAPLEVR
ncbi:hypothetical protein K438DRAFT_1902237 [Mycena galopus ATCC 62051]|nr:hypothetical protein K438DRAFT_1902237 [Mycena galopus ATCC 62051]